MFAFRPLRSTVVARFLASMGRSDSRRDHPAVIYSRKALARAASPGLPGSSTDLSSRAVSYHPGRSDGCCYPLLPHRCQASPLSGGLATFAWTNEAEMSSLALRLTSSPRQGFARRITPPRAHRATCRMGNLQGELLSVHKIDQACPGAPEEFTQPRRMGLICSINPFTG
jgi:hypothetical protein